MTGEVYTGTAWEELQPEDRAEDADLFYWLHKDDFYGQEMIGRASDVTDSEEEIHTLQVQNLNACRGHLYLPYGLQGTELLEPDLIGDAQTAAGRTQWTMSYRSGSVPSWYGILQTLSNGQNEPEEAEYLRQEESYRDYVNEKDLELTDAARQTLDRLLPDGEGTLTLSEIKERIFQCLEQNLAYDEDTVTTTGNQDFLSYTLEQKRKGYSVHYATAATLMLRYYGVPARYVEGYLLTRPVPMHGQSIIWMELAGSRSRRHQDISIRKRSESMRTVVLIRDTQVRARAIHSRRPWNRQKYHRISLTGH